ncbi:hypothetical protein SDC9_134894 [bioreactor metagenome]|uniref:Uncharacterized protein n=1 Tax=bioreactor metagenome TaxID=1076179 RepID=A0A645DED7_9ZZZZ
MNDRNLFQLNIPLELCNSLTSVLRNLGSQNFLNSLERSVGSRKNIANNAELNNGKNEQSDIIIKGGKIT